MKRCNEHFYANKIKKLNGDDINQNEQNVGKNLILLYTWKKLVNMYIDI